MYKDLQLPSDFLIDNHKSLSKRRDFEDLCESLDDLQHEAMNLAFQDGLNQCELNVLRQFVEGKLDRDCVLEIVGDKLGLSKDEKHTCKLPKRDRKVSMTEIRIENF
jgi:hypothetical protein